MGTYIIRRLLLMIPTIIGITFLIFMLIALSPGGIGAGLRVAGGQMEATSRALQEAYLEDRYGLNDPVVVQYGRWLSRVSPVKFGEREQIAPDGSRQRAPRAIDPPVGWQWITDDLAPAVAEPFAWPDDATEESKDRAFRRQSNAYAQARARSIAAATEFEQALSAYLRAVELDEFVFGTGKVRPAAINKHTPNRDLPEWQAAQALGEQSLAAYQGAINERQNKITMLRAKPYREAGVPIIPGTLSLALPDLGVSFARSRPVSTLIAEALPITLLLNVIAFVLIYLIAVPSGMLAAARSGTAIDVGLGALYVALWSFPIPLAGVLAIGFLASNDYLGAFPVAGLHDSAADTFAFLPTFSESGAFQRGYLLDSLWHVCLPVLCLVYGGFAVLSKQTRAAMLENYNADYVRTAKAKGVAPRDVLFRHVFRNSLLPLITMFVSIFPAMLSGSVVIERIFSVQGMGNLAIEAINLRDRELILATTLIVGAVNLLALLLADILYALADPRISYE